MLENSRGWITSPFQSDFWVSNADELFWGSSRGASKTFCAIGKLLAKAQVLKGFQGVIFRKLFREFPKAIYPACEKWFKMLDDPQFKLIKSLDPRIEHSGTGSVIHISAAVSQEDAEKFQGGNFHAGMIDEGQQIAQRVLEKIPAVIRSVSGDYKPQIIWLANPNGPGHAWLKRRFLLPAYEVSSVGNILHEDWRHPLTGEMFKIRGHWRFSHNQEVSVEGQKSIVSKQLEVFLSKTWMNPALDYHKYIADLKHSLKDNFTLALQWIDNDWDAIAGEFFPRLHDAIVENVYISRDNFIVCGIDPGQRKTACVWAAVDADGNYVVFDEAVYHNMDITTKAPLIANAHRETKLYIIDPNSGRQTLEGSGVRTIRKSYMEAGLPNVVLCKTRDRRSGWESLRTGFSDGSLRISKKCRNTIDSLSSLVAKETDSEDCDKDDGTDFMNDGDHLSDALRYLFVNGFYQSEEDSYDMARDDPYLYQAVLDSYGTKSVSLYR